MSQKTVDHHPLGITDLLRDDTPGSTRVTFAKRFEERLVAVHRVIAVRLQEHAELDDSLALDQELVDQGGNARIAAGSGDGRVECPVRLVELANGHRVSHFVADPAPFLESRRGFGVQAPGRERYGRRFDDDAQSAQILDISQGDWCHDISPAWVHEYEALVYELPERLANRGLAELHLRGNLTLSEPLAW